MKAPVSLTLLCGFLAAVASTFQSRADVLPDTVTAMLGSHHTGNTARTSDDTQGIAIGWPVAGMPFDGFDLALYRNSQLGSPQRLTLYAGISKEWRVLPRLYAGAAGGVTFGYREELTQILPRGSSPAHAVTCGPAQVACAYDAFGPPKWLPAARLSLRWQATQYVSPVIAYSPKSQARGAAAWTLGIKFNKEF